MRIATLLLCVFLGGCAQFTNRIAMSVACDEVYFASRYLRFLVGSDIDPRDAKAILDAHCKKP